MFKFIKSKIKATHSANFFTDVQNAKSETSEVDTSRHDNANLLYEEGLVFIDRFSDTLDKEDLYKASEKMEESLRLQKNKGETYFWIGYILFLFGKDKEAFKYIKIAETLCPNYHKIAEFKNNI